MIFYLPIAIGLAIYKPIIDSINNIEDGRHLFHERNSLQRIVFIGNAHEPRKVNKKNIRLKKIYIIHNFAHLFTSVSNSFKYIYSKY